jgi:hypothetical protein
MAKSKKRGRPKKSDNPASSVLETVVGDTSGLQTIRTPAGNRGYSVLVDAKSRYIDVELLKSKDQVQNHVEKFKAFSERKQGAKWKTFRTDNAKEYVLKKTFVEKLVGDGVKMEQCCDYEHAQNGLAEREIGMIATLAQCNMEQAGAPKWLWGEAVLHAATQRILQARKALDYSTPFSVWNNRVPSLEMLKPWGCLAIAHIPVEKRQKKDIAGQRCIYLGVDKSKKGYRLLTLADRKVIVTTNAIFHEEVFPFKLKSIADYVVQQIVPGGITELDENWHSEMQYNEHQKKYTPTVDEVDEIPVHIVPPRSATTSAAKSSNTRVNSPVMTGNTPSTPVLQIATPQSTPSPQQQKIPMATPPLVLRTPTPTVAEKMFISAGKSVNHNDAMVQKMMKDFDPSAKRRRVRANHQSNAMIEDSNYFAILSDYEDESNCVEDMDQEFCYLMKEGPFSYGEAMRSPNRDHHIEAAKRELKAFVENDVYELVPNTVVPVGHKILHPRWVFGQKWDDSFKARLTVNGSAQKKGIHFGESRSDTLCLPLMRFMLSIMMLLKMIPFQFDVPNAFLQSDIDTTVFMRQPEGFISKEHPDWVWRLKRCVYGLKQASLRWRSTLHDFVVHSLKFQEVGYNTCVYILTSSSSIVAILLVYVDDLILGCSDSNLQQDIVRNLVMRFRVKELGEIRKYLGMEFHRMNDKLFISQTEYIEKVLSDLNMSNMIPLEVPQPDGLAVRSDDDTPFDKSIFLSTIGKLIWISVCTRPDISFYVSYYASFSSNPTKQVWNHILQLLRYLNNTKKMGITLNANPSMKYLVNYVDAGHANEFYDRRSVSGNIHMFLNAPIQWSSKKIHSVIKSTMEAEYVSMSNACYDSKYLLMICSHVFPSIKGVDIFTDSVAAKSIAEGTGQVRKVKHLDTHQHIVRQMVLEGKANLHWISSKDNISDLLTKHVGNHRLFLSLRDMCLSQLA